jgi:parafibromin
MPLAAPRKNRNREGIILLSPSASSLLQMANIKEFLENGVFKPVEAAGVSAPSMLKISRQLPNLSQTSPYRFNIVDSTTNFKPEYWQRVVAVFTTGQQWQFKSYMWSAPTELFRHVKGFYVGWEGEKIPETVKNWGSGVTTLTLERQRRSRDKEVAEILWMDLERWMGEHGWSRD